MKRNEDCNGCSWNFGRPDFPCQFCQDHALFTDFPYHPSEDKYIQKMVIKSINAVIFMLLGVACGMTLTEILEEVKKEHAKVQEKDNLLD